MSNRSLKVFVARLLRDLGFVTKNPKPVKLTPRVQSTAYPAQHESFIKVQRFAYLYNKRNSFKNCQFDPETETCPCGMSVDDFGRSGCSKRTNKTANTQISI